MIFPLAMIGVSLRGLHAPFFGSLVFDLSRALETIPVLD